MAGVPGVSPEPQASREHTVGTRLVARHTTSGGVHDHGQVSRKPGHKPDWKARPRSWPAEQGEHMWIRTQVSRLSGVRHAPGPGSQQRAPATGRLLPVGLRPEGRWAGTREHTEGRGAKLYNYLCPSGGHIKRTHTHTHTHRGTRTHSMCTRTHTRAHTCTHTCIHRHTHTQTCTHMRTRAHTHSGAHTHMHERAHIQAHAHAHTHTQTHTHTYEIKREPRKNVDPSLVAPAVPGGSEDPGLC